MSWPTAKLGDICCFTYGKSLSEDSRDGGSNNVYGSNGVVGKHSKAITEGETIIIGRKGSLGEVNWADDSCWPIDTTYYIDKNSTNQNLRWLYWRLKGLHLTKMNKSAAVPGLNREDAYRLELRVPSLSEQERIASILDKAAEIKAKREQAISKLDELRKCVFNDLLQKNQDNLTTVKLGVVCNFVRGPFGGALKKEIFKNDGYAVYEQQHAIYDQFTDVRYYVDRAKFEEMKRFELRAGDLIMSCSGTMGKVAIVPEGIRQGIINQALLKLTPTNKLNVRYLKEYMEGSLFQASLENETHGAAIKNVASVAVLKELPIALPTIDVQNEIAKIINNIFELVKLNNQHLEKDAALISSLQHQAFTTGFAV